MADVKTGKKNVSLLTKDQSEIRKRKQENGYAKLHVNIFFAPSVDVYSPRNLRMRIQALMTDDCSQHQYTGLGELFGALSLYAVKKFQISDIF